MSDAEIAVASDLDLTAIFAVSTHREVICAITNNIASIVTSRRTLQRAYSMSSLRSRLTNAEVRHPIPLHDIYDSPTHHRIVGTVSIDARGIRKRRNDEEEIAEAEGTNQHSGHG